MTAIGLCWNGHVNIMNRTEVYLDHHVIWNKRLCDWTKIVVETVLTLLYCLLNVKYCLQNTYHSLVPVCIYNVYKVPIYDWDAAAKQAISQIHREKAWSSLAIVIPQLCSFFSF